MDFNSMVQFSSNWILVLACASLTALALFLVSATAFAARTEKRKGKSVRVILYLIVVLAYAVLNMTVLVHPEFRKQTGLLPALLSAIPLIAAFLYLQAISSYSGGESRSWNPVTVVFLSLILLFTGSRFLPQEWNVPLNVLVLLYLLSAAGISFYRSSRQVQKSSSGNAVLFIQLIALVVFILAAVNDFSMNTVDFVLLPDNILIAGLAVLGAFLTVLFFSDVTAVVTASRRDNRLSGLSDELRGQYSLTMEISRETEIATEKLFARILNFVMKCSESIERINGMEAKVKNNVNEIKQKLSEFLGKVEPVLQDKKKTEESGRTVDEIKNILEEIENKGKIVSSGVVNLTSVIDSAKKNTEKSQKIILEIRTDMDNIESFSQTIDNIAGEANVLAMNAAIESANQSHASTNGFRVVSDDLRELSSRIKGQTSEIQKVLAVLKQDLETGIHSTQNVNSFFQEIEIIIENIFRLIINIVNHSDTISNTVEDTHQNIGSLEAITSRMEEMVGKNTAMTVDLNREVEQTRANFYQIAMLVKKGKEVFDRMFESIEKNNDRIDRLVSDRKGLENAIAGMACVTRKE